MTFQPQSCERKPIRSTEATERQVAYVRGMQKRLQLSDRLLDAWCERQFGVAFGALTIGDCRTLIDQMTNWASIPAELMRLTGQMDMFGGEG